MGFVNNIKKIDVIKFIPDKMKEASVLGLVFSFFFIILTVGLVLNQTI